MDSLILTSPWSEGILRPWKNRAEPKCALIDQLTQIGPKQSLGDYQHFTILDFDNKKLHDLGISIIPLLSFFQTNPAIYFANTSI